jgi:hypothetical protein
MGDVVVRLLATTLATLRRAWDQPGVRLALLLARGG